MSDKILNERKMNNIIKKKIEKEIEIKICK